MQIFLDIDFPPPVLHCGVLINSIVFLSLQKLLVYKCSIDKSSSPCFKLVWQRSFAHPLHCVWYGDITHDGLSELVVLSMGGVHILQVSVAKLR